MPSGPRITSTKGIFSVVHRDESGSIVGESRPGIIPGTYNHYAPDGSFLGSSVEGVLSVKHYDPDGSFAGDTVPSAFGAETYDSEGDHFASSTPDLFGMSTDFD